MKRVVDLPEGFTITLRTQDGNGRYDALTNAWALIALGFGDKSVIGETVEVTPSEWDRIMGGAAQ